MKNWIPDSVIYQVNLRAFAAREPRNPVEVAEEVVAGWKGSSPIAFLTRNLEHIKTLGANVVYLMPPFPTGVEGRKGVGSNYSIRDFKAVDSEYGTLDEFKALVARVHELGLKIIVDLTPNHTSRDHVWTQVEGVHCRRADGSLFYDFDWSDVAKLDYANTRTRQEMAGVLAFWLELCSGDGVDGFRFDMAHMINDLSFWDETLPGLQQACPDRKLLFLAESYGVGNNRGLFGRGMNAAYDDDFYKVCFDGYARDQSGRSRGCLSKDAFGNPDLCEKASAFSQAGIAAAFELALMDYATRDAGEKGPWVARYVDNHDEGRGIYRFGREAVMAVMRLVFLSGNCLPFLLCGQEFGAENRPTIHDRIKPCDKGYRVCAPDGTHRETVEGVEFEGNLFARLPDERSRLYRFYRELIALRAANPALRRGDTRLLDAGEVCDPHARAVVAFERLHEGARLRCAVNMGEASRRLSNHAMLSGRPLYGSLDGDTLAPFSAVVSMG